MNKEKLKKLEDFLFKKLYEGKAKIKYYCPPMDDEEISERGENLGYIEAICQVIDELNYLKNN